jgi:hypothetical protein
VSEDSEVSLETFLRKQQEKSNEVKSGPCATEVIETIKEEPKTKTEALPATNTSFETYSEVEVTQHSLVVEVFPVNITIPGTKKKSEIVEPQHAISHYFSSQALPKSDKYL